ncbi:hypothetical protein MP638_003642 [Amoeboaphelidium occidentale]|nr:hypothetical protein MP638_003642 [Amoeboaphelidium occidentale]
MTIESAENQPSEETHEVSCMEDGELIEMRDNAVAEPPANEDVWDDTELVKFWNATIDQFKSTNAIKAEIDGKVVREIIHEAPMPGKWQTVKVEAESLAESKKYKISDQELDHCNTSLELPHIVQKLTEAWYNVGYYTALYEMKTTTNKTN